MSIMRLTGMVSGLDTEKMIKDLMKAENTRLDKIKRDKQYAIWQQEGYRGIIDKLRTLQSSYFDVLKPRNNVASASSFAHFNYSIMSNGSNSTALTVSATGNVTNKNQVVDKITKLASKDTYSGNDADLRGIKISATDIAGLKNNLAGSDFEMTLSVGSSAKLIKISNASLSDGMTSTEFEGLLRTEIINQFGSDYTNLVKASGSGLEFDLAGNEVKVLTYDTNTVSLTALNLTNNQSNLAYKTKTVGELFGFTSSSVSINGKAFVIDESETVDQMMSRMNKSDLGVEMTYDTLSDKFTIKSTKEGSVNNISIGDATTESFFKSLLNTGVASLSTVRTEGQNANLQINGVDIIQSSNAFTYDGISYNLKELSNDPINIEISTNKTEIINNIKNFITAYNEILDDINGKISERKNFDYRPLTDEEKEAMNDEEIKKWEDAAKLGILRGANELSDMVLKMRNALVEPIEGLGITLADIGIKSENYSARGKLVVNEEILSAKLDSNFDEIVSLFSKQSDIGYDSGNSATRSRENGIGRRLDDILKDYVRTTRGTNGQKGILLVKAGIQNDTSFTQNDISKRIATFDSRLDTMMSFLANREDYYYRMFSRMESALSEMNNQASSIMGMMGMNQ
ncbi:MAG TPA: hypothetical protein DCS67_12880 [Clostridiales bacterium UBA8960]|nr:hypothetical protein [Clostridiales bacterium UBA8960]